MGNLVISGSQGKGMNHIFIIFSVHDSRPANSNIGATFGSPLPGLSNKTHRTWQTIHALHGMSLALVYTSYI